MGLGFAYPVDQRSGWEILNGAPKENVATCNVQSMIDAGWTLRPRRFRSRDAYKLACARYGIPMSINAVAAEGDTILSLPQLCFATSGGDKESFDAALRFPVLIGGKFLRAGKELAGDAFAGAELLGKMIGEAPGELENRGFGNVRRGEAGIALPANLDPGEKIGFGARQFV